MKIAVGTIFYNDLAGLKRLFESLGDIDHWFCIDGRFDLMEGEHDYSDDGSREFVTSCKNTTLHDYSGTEHDKRNQYLKLCEENNVDVLLVLDSDEYVICKDWKKLRASIKSLDQTQNFHSVWSNFVGSWGWYPRLWLRPHEIEYSNAHCMFKNKRTGIVTRSISVNGSVDFMDVIQLKGDDSLRSKEWIEKTFHYQEKMIKRELPFRKKR